MDHKYGVTKMFIIIVSSMMSSITGEVKIIKGSFGLFQNAIGIQNFLKIFSRVYIHVVLVNKDVSRLKSKAITLFFCNNSNCLKNGSNYGPLQ